MGRKSTAKKARRDGKTDTKSSGYFERKAARYRAEVASNRPKFRQEIDSRIQEILSIASSRDPLELLRHIAMGNVFADPEEYRESTHEGKEHLVEYALSIITGIEKPAFGATPSDDELDKFEELLLSTYNAVMLYFSSEVTEQKLSEQEYKARFQSLLKTLYLRGDSIYEHHVDLMHALFTPHDDFLIRNFGFSTQDVISSLAGMERQLVSGVVEPPLFAKLATELHSDFKKFLDDRTIDDAYSLEEIRNLFFSMPGIMEKKQELQLQLDRTKDDVWKDYFKVEPRDGVSRELLDILSIEFGENREFNIFEKSPAWPTNISKTAYKPIIKHDSEYYVFSPQLIFRNTIEILENLIQSSDKRYYGDDYQDKRASVLEDLAIGCFKKLLPGVSVYRNLYYSINEDGLSKRPETDAVLVYDGNVFIIEAKAGSLAKASRRGGLKSIKGDVKALIADAHNQAIRTRDYILSSTTASFEDEAGNKALTLHREDVQNIFLVNVTMENLNQFSTRLPDLRELGLVKEKDWLWSVFINDLRVISEMIEFPSEFLLYLKRRIRANDYPQFHVSDELDLLMYFFDHGLFLEGSEVENYSMYSIGNYTEALDRYYDYKAGRVSSSDKPRLKISEEFKDFIQTMERSGVKGFSRACVFLLDLSGDRQDELLSYLDQLKMKMLFDGRRHDCSIVLKKIKTGLTFFFSMKESDLNNSELRKYIETKMYQLRIESWITIDALLTEGGVKYRFEAVESKWSYDQKKQDQFYKFVKEQNLRKMLSKASQEPTLGLQ